MGKFRVSLGTFMHNLTSAPSRFRSSISIAFRGPFHFRPPREPQLLLLLLPLQLLRIGPSRTNGAAATVPFLLPQTRIAGRLAGIK